MEIISKENCENIGFIRKLHGIHGEIVLEYEYQFESSIEIASRFFIELEGLLVPFFMNENGFRFKSAKTAILNFKWVETENYAKRLIGQNVFLLKNEIVPDKEEETGFINLENYSVFDAKLGKLGKIEKIDDYSGNIVFTIQYKNSELLIPFHEEILVSMNHVLKQITLKIPAGLI